MASSASLHQLCPIPTTPKAIGGPTDKLERSRVHPTSAPKSPFDEGTMEPSPKLGDNADDQVTPMTDYMAKIIPSREEQHSDHFR